MKYNISNINHLNKFFLLPSEHHYGYKSDFFWMPLINDKTLINGNGECLIKKTDSIVKSYFIFFPFEQSSKQDVRISIVVNSSFFCYIDDKLIYWRDKKDACIITLKLQPGKHCLYFQIPGEIKKFVYSIQIFSCNFDDEIEDNFFLKRSMYIKEKQTQNEYQFYIGERNFITSTQKNKLIVYNINNQMVLHDKVLLETNYRFTDKDMKLPKSDIYFLVIENVRSDNEKQIIKTQFTLDTFQIDYNYEQTKEKLIKVYKNASEYIKKEIEIRLYAMANTKDVERYWETSLAQLLYSWILDYPNEHNFNNKIYLPIYYHYNKVYYHSTCHMSPCYYYLHLPEFPLQDDKEYKVVMDLTFGQDDFYCTDERRYNQGDVIHVFAPQVGHLLGNSIGETHYLDIVNYLKSLFLKEYPIYLIGYSNGAHAAWVLAEKYPHTISGIYTVSGLPYQEHLSNLSNLYIRNISSTDDELYMGAYKLLKDELSTIADFKGFLAEKSYHSDLHYWLYDSTFMKELLSFEKDKVPSHFSFITKSNYHLQIYWIKLLPIRKYCRQIKLNVDVADEHIYISISGAQGFIISKDFMRGKIFNIHINKQESFSVTDTGHDITLYYNDNIACYTTSCDLHIIPYMRFSIAEFFCKGVDILLQDNNKIFLQLAKNLASPKTFFLDMQSNVTYRIIDNVEQAVKGNNIIFISQYHNSLKNIIHMQFNEIGFNYKGESYLGEYCVIGVEHHEDKFVLFIITNNVSLLKTNIFLRLILIPSYANEYSSMLNKQSLILLNNTYYSIYEWGGKIEEEKLY